MRSIFIVCESTHGCRLTLLFHLERGKINQELCWPSLATGVSQTGIWVSGGLWQSNPIGRVLPDFCHDSEVKSGQQHGALCTEYSKPGRSAQDWARRKQKPEHKAHSFVCHSWGQKSTLDVLGSRRLEEHGRMANPLLRDGSCFRKHHLARKSSHSGLLCSRCGERQFSTIWLPLHRVGVDRAMATLYVQMRYARRRTMQPQYYVPSGRYFLQARSAADMVAFAP